MPLPAVAFCPFRPLGKSHFIQSPVAVEIDKNLYLPSDMSVEALKVSITKYCEPIAVMPEELLGKAFRFLHSKLSAFWFGDNEMSYADAVASLKKDTSPGYPYYYLPGCDSKYGALDGYGNLVLENNRRLCSGVKLPLPFTLTLKDELRTKDRVLAHKTRAFMASGLDHLIASKMVFCRQNDKLMDTIGKHPITLGLSVPGPSFVRAVLSLGENAYDADGDGWDLRFNLGLARVIRDVRLSYLSMSRKELVHYLYNTVYCGYVVTLGVLYVLLHQKSGWENTAMDNSLKMWAMLFLAFDEMGYDFENCVKLLINGDDLAIGLHTDNFEMSHVVSWLQRFNVRLEFSQLVARPSYDLNFLSHSLCERFVRGFGDIVVCRGNLSKLLSSLNYVKPSVNLSWEGSVLVHLLGLRICLWPWEVWFDTVNQRIDSYLSGIDKTPEIRNLLKGRLSEVDIVRVHTRVELGLVFSPAPEMI